MRKLISLCMIAILTACSAFTLVKEKEFPTKGISQSLTNEQKDSESDGVVLFSLEEESQEY